MELAFYSRLWFQDILKNHSLSAFYLRIQYDSQFSPNFFLIKKIHYVGKIDDIFISQ